MQGHTCATISNLIWHNSLPLHYCCKPDSYKKNTSVDMGKTCRQIILKTSTSSHWQFQQGEVRIQLAVWTGDTSTEQHKTIADSLCLPAEWVASTSVFTSPSAANKMFLTVRSLCTIGGVRVWRKRRPHTIEIQISNCFWRLSWPLLVSYTSSHLMWG